MDKYKVKVNPRAIRELDQIYEYIANEKLAPENAKGQVDRIHGTLTGIALLPASVIAGFLWNHISSSAPFVFGAAMSTIAAFLLLFGMRGGQKLTKQFRILTK